MLPHLNVSCFIGRQLIQSNGSRRYSCSASLFQHYRQTFHNNSTQQQLHRPVLCQQPNKQQSISAIRTSTTAAGASHGDHAKLWTAEKALSLALVGVVPAAFMFTNPALDYLMALAITIHSHWGIEAIVIDYIRPSIFGEAIPKVAVGAVYALSILTLGGLFYFNYTDVGLTNAVKMLWKL